MPITFDRVLLKIKPFGKTKKSDFELVGIEKRKMVLPKLSGFDAEFASVATFVAKYGGICKKKVYQSPKKALTIDWMRRLYAVDENHNRTKGYVNEVARTSIKIPYMQISDLLRPFTIAQKYFIMCHEIGHYLTKSLDELACDRVALQMYLKRGFPKSEAFYALTDILTDKPESYARIQQMKNLIGGAL
jgi:hypothetical protein